MDFKELKLTFQHEGREVTQQGMKGNAVIQMMSGEAMSKMINSLEAVTLVQIFAIEGSQEPMMIPITIEELTGE